MITQPKFRIKYAIVASLLTVTVWATPASAQVLVSYDPNAPVSNFGLPTSTTNSVPYTITMTADTTDIYLTLATTSPVPENFGLNFANLYFSTNVADGGGGHSTIGFEVENNDAFIPGGNPPISTLNDHFVTSTAPGNIQVAIPWSYFENDPDGLGFDKVTSTNDIVRLNLSQSFGDSVAGGTTYGSTELGEVLTSGEVINAPEPSVWAMLLGGLVLLTVPRFWRRNRNFI